ncbi:MAG: MFS transporter, partial [Desulfovibrio sp.]|nr:MFS transporter [Desulfovibrio sp.]
MCTHPKEEKLLRCEFWVLFFQATCCNCFIAVFYCMEQWMAKIQIGPSCRGLLLSMLAVTVFLTRPMVTYLFYNKQKTKPIVWSITLTSLIMLCYPWVQEELAVSQIFCLRLLQGLSLAVYSSCTISLLVDCIPKGQSARGFDIFSLTLLLPYAIIPAVGEFLIALTGGEPNLFAWTSILGIPALLSLVPLRKKLKQQ